jgi:hypothetical protein
MFSMILMMTVFLFFSHKKFKSYFTFISHDHFLLLFKQKIHNKTLYQTHPVC